jgi:hypothetical protein
MIVKDEVAARPRRLGKFLKIATVLGVIAGVGSVVPLLMSFMVFDAGETRDAWTLFIVIWSVPIVMLGALGSAWIAYGARAFKVCVAALVVWTVPFLAICALVIPSLLAMGLSWFGIQ